MAENCPYHQAAENLGTLREGVRREQVVTLIWRWVEDEKRGILDSRLSKGEHTKLKGFGAAAAEMKASLAALPTPAREYIEHCIATRVLGGSSLDAQRWLGALGDQLLEIERIVDDAADWTHRPQPGKALGENKAIRMWSLMDIYEWATGDKAVRSKSSAFSLFVENVWPLAFGSMKGADTALRAAQKFKSQPANFNNWLKITLSYYR